MNPWYRSSKPMDKATFEKIESYMCSCMSDSAHDKEHVYRVLGNAMVIAEGEQPVDYDILLCACLLHDIGRTDQLKNPELCHAQVGADKACEWLKSQGWADDFANAVAGCIRTHRFRKNAPPQSLEAKILFDADKLDVVGAIGIARTMAYQGTVGAALYSRTPEGTVSDGREDTQPSFFQEYHYKLEKLYDRFLTTRGAELAKQRQTAAARFYEDLYHEILDFDRAGKESLSKLLEEA